MGKAVRFPAGLQGRVGQSLYAPPQTVFLFPCGPLGVTERVTAARGLLRHTVKKRMSNHQTCRPRSGPTGTAFPAATGGEGAALPP